jgi:hypothetical protein
MGEPPDSRNQNMSFFFGVYFVVYSNVEAIAKWNMKGGISETLREIVTGYSNDKEVMKPPSKASRLPKKSHQSKDDLLSQYSRHHRATGLANFQNLRFMSNSNKNDGLTIRLVSIT